MSYPQQSAPSPKRFNKAPLIGLAILIVLAISFFAYLSGPKVMDLSAGYTGKATVISTKIKGQKCYLEIRRDDETTELRASGYRNECAKYEKGQRLTYVKGIIQD